MVDSLEKPKFAKIIPGNIEPNNLAKLEILYETNKKTRLMDMLEQIISMTQHMLNAEAASILLFRANDHDLYFEVASGPVGRALRQVKLNTQYGIAGQVVRTGKPLIVNDVARSPNFHKIIDDTTGFVTRSLVCAPLIVHRKTLGVIEVLNKRDGSAFGEEDMESVISVANTAAMSIENTRLHDTVLDAYKNTVSALAAAIDAKDSHMRGHSQRVMEYSLQAGAALFFSPEEMETLEYGSVLHDVGKIAIDSSILNKPGPLTAGEWEIMRAHPVIGAELIKEIPFLEKASELVLYHHERFDGTGYPDGLRAEDIPMGARVIAVADAFDAMTVDSSYRGAISVEKATKELNDCAGSQFCPKAVKAFISGMRLDGTNN
ncbi:MAG: HD domain-containing protein [Dehalococcoidales bacterium]|nr:HD domain-containing protein [Dehalococcoidales bacterium]